MPQVYLEAINEPLKESSMFSKRFFFSGRGKVGWTALTENYTTTSTDPSQPQQQQQNKDYQNKNQGGKKIPLQMSNHNPYMKK